METFSKAKKTQVLADDLEEGTCFLLLFSARGGDKPYLIKGQLSY